MADFDQFERSLASALRSDADMSVAGFEPATIASAAMASGQPRSVRMPRRFTGMPWTNRWPVAAAAVIGVLVVGVGILVVPRGRPAVVGGPSPTSGSDASPSVPAAVAPSQTPSETPSQSVASPRAGTWIATGTMGTPRSGYTTVRLLDGRVLAAGGYMGLEPDDAITSAELYDPESGTWSATGNMVKPHAGFPATLLRDGRVLVGDIDLADVGDGRTRTAEVYDPASGTWSATGNMVADRGGNAEGTLLRDGRVLVTGRYGAELYDPDSGTWTATGKMIEPPAQHAAVLLPDGNVLVVKGDHLRHPVELYDPATGTWSAGADMHESYMGVSATLLGNGNVLVLGGQFNGPISAELYDPASGTWTVVEEFPRVSTTGATLLSDGRVLLPGPDGFRLYDPDSGTWTAAASPEHGGDATLLLDGRVLVVGPEASELYIPGGP